MTSHLQLPVQVSEQSGGSKKGALQVYPNGSDRVQGMSASAGAEPQVDTNARIHAWRRNISQSSCSSTATTSLSARPLPVQEEAASESELEVSGEMIEVNEKKVLCPF